MNKASFDPATTTPEDAAKVVAQIAELLGVEATHDAVEKALQALFAAVTDDGSDQLTESERTACRSLGCRPADFVTLKKSTSDGAYKERLRRANAAR
jgi:hypothetical protein